MKYSKVRLTVSFIASVFLSFTLASIMHSQFVLAGLTELNVDLTLATRLSFTVTDWLGLLPGYGTVILLSLLFGFCIVGFCRKYFDWNVTISFALGGAIAFLTMLVAMYPLLNITLIAGSRSMFGLIAQCMAGALGGYVFSFGVVWSRESENN